MATIATDQSEVLQAVVDRLIAAVDFIDLSTTICQITLEPDVVFPQRSHNLYVTVSPMDSQFDESQEGGGEDSCIEQGGFTVTIHSAMKLDRVGDCENAMTNPTRGILGLKKSILKALVGHELVDGSGNGLVTDLISALNSDRGRYDKDAGIFRMSISFACDWLWDLS